MANLKKVLMLGGGPLQVPAIDALKRAGHYVICADYDENAPGFELSDEYAVISTLDQEAIYGIAANKSVDYIITSTSDAPVRVAAYVSERLGLPTGISYQSAIAATQKDVMRERLDSSGIAIPGYKICCTLAEFETALEFYQFNCVVKPADSAASRGVMLVEGTLSNVQISALYEATLEVSKKGIVMVEERMEGFEVSVEALTINKQTVVVAITDKLITPPPYFVELGHSEPSALSSADQASVANLACQAIEAIGIVSGPSHTEIMITKDGPKVVEIAARLGGDYITSKLVPLSTGVDIVALSVALAVGDTIDIPDCVTTAASIGFLTSSAGIIAEIQIDDSLYSLPGFYELELYKKPGEAASIPHSSNDRIGHIICIGGTRRDVDESMRRAKEKIKVILA